jgi:hypothetical protein
MTRANLWGSHITVEDEVASRFIEHRLRFVPDEDRPSEFMIQQIIELYHEYLETLGLVTKDNGP